MKQAQTDISYRKRTGNAALALGTGVSLHSHTSLSEESLTFIHRMFTEFSLLRPLFSFYERRSQRLRGIPLDFVSAHWRPPLQPRMAFDLERKQIEGLDLQAMVSITDHDNIQAPLLLRALPEARRIPVSVEWTAPFGRTIFHLGVHNLPSAEALAWMRRLAAFTAAPSDHDLRPILRDLSANPTILVVLNHPLWDLYKLKHKHVEELERFLSVNGDLIHALELNGLRHARENREVVALARRFSQLLISGGDRHGLEPNANINLTSVDSFAEFVSEIRFERKSHILFMEQYSRPWELRILDSTLDAVLDHSHFSPGWQRWDERAFHRDLDGAMRPLSELWSNGHAPLALRVAISCVRMLRFRQVAGLLGWMLPRVDAEPVGEELPLEDGSAAETA